MYQGEVEAVRGGQQALSLFRPSQITPRAGKAQGLKGLGGWWDEGFVDPSNNFPNFPSGGSGGSSGGSGFDWSEIFGVIQHTLPAAISAIKGQGVPPGYYPINAPGYTTQQYSQIPPGYAYQNGQLVPVGSAANAGAQAGAGFANLANSVSTFVTNNPLVVLGGAVALLLLFKTPPSRR